MRYRPAWELQEALRQAILQERGEETLLLLEHEPVITLGRSAAQANILRSPEELARLGVEVVPTSRGGDVTYHGPGQLVGYPIFRAPSVLRHVQGMADALVRVLAPLGIEAAFRRDIPGVWVGQDKIAAFGVHIHRRVAIHGFALNVATPLDAFSLIVPCGLRCSGVTSIQALGKQAPELPSLARRVAAAFAAVRGEEAVEVGREVLLAS